MRILCVLDSKDYDQSLPRTTRNAVRAIILSGGKLVLVRSDLVGEYKFPGGGAEPGETHSETVIRDSSVWDGPGNPQGRFRRRHF
jgi:hypothetical protein